MSEVISFPTRQYNTAQLAIQEMEMAMEEIQHWNCLIRQAIIFGDRRNRENWIERRNTAQNRWEKAQERKRLVEHHG